MKLEPVQLGAARGPSDGGRRYRPIEVTFDTRNLVLGMEIRDDWEPQVRASWQHNKAAITNGLVAELGTYDSHEKLENYAAMGPAPWSIVFEHNRILTQVRAAFAHGDFFPALVGACALGERIFNQLIQVLRDDFREHPRTVKRVRKGETITDWKLAVAVLHGWGVFSAEVVRRYDELRELRHASVHFAAGLPVDTRPPALRALELLQGIVAEVFQPHGDQEPFIPGTPGASFIRKASETVPLVRRVFLPRSVLVSPTHRVATGTAGVEVVLDDVDYDTTELTDGEFAAALPDGRLAAHPELIEP